MNRVRALFELHVRRPTATTSVAIGPRREVTNMADERYRGAAVRSLPRPNRRYSSGRVCAEPGCGTRLSVYSKWSHCWQHEPAHDYVPRGKRRSRSEAA